MNLLKSFLLALTLMLFAGTSLADNMSTTLDNVINSEHRSPESRARDSFRHPKQVLQFFGLQANMQVLEILPGQGWYTEILAPLLRDTGKLTVASFGADNRIKFFAETHKKYIAKLMAKPAFYDEVKVVKFKQEGYLDALAKNSVDMVVTFRNTHNWIRFGGTENATEIYAAFHRILKHGGILGVVQHRAISGSNPLKSAQAGYVEEKYLIQLAESLGFELVDKSEINANPKDIKDYPDGVWSLPPTYRSGKHEKYTAIGESDRMTLKFIKL